MMKWTRPRRANGSMRVKKQNKVGFSKQEQSKAEARVKWRIVAKVSWCRWNRMAVVTLNRITEK